MKCKKCGKSHRGDHEHLKSTISAKGFPVSSSKYAASHRKASEEEKKRFPKGYEQLKKLDRSAGQKHQMLGTHTKSGKVEISKQVPKPLRKEVKFHEKTEAALMKKKK